MERIREDARVTAKVPGIEQPLDRQNARAVVEAFVAAALAGDSETAKTLAKNLSSDHIADLANGLNVQRLAIQSVYVNDPTKPVTALATSEAVKLSKPNPDGQRDGFLLLTLTMSEAGWSVTDIDFESEESADRKLKKFLEANPKSIGVPPTTASIDKATHLKTPVTKESSDYRVTLLGITRVVAPEFTTADGISGGNRPLSWMRSSYRRYLPAMAMRPGSWRAI